MAEALRSDRRGSRFESEGGYARRANQPGSWASLLTSALREEWASNAPLSAPGSWRARAQTGLENRAAVRSREGSIPSVSAGHYPTGEGARLISGYARFDSAVADWAVAKR